MCKGISVSIAALTALLLGTAPVLAGDATRIAAAPQASAPATAVPIATQQDHRTKLEMAAQLGMLDAQVRLAHMYVTGEGVERDHAKAFDLYRKIANDNADISPRDTKASAVANAFVTLAGYYRNGIARHVRADRKMSRNLLSHAAGYLGDSKAQHLLAQDYLSGEFTPRNASLAIGWLIIASKKRHAGAQALLGTLLWTGAKDIRRQPLKGLAFLELARQNAAGVEAEDVAKMHGAAFAEAQEHERKGAARYVTMWQERMGNPLHVASATGSQSEPQTGSLAVNPDGLGQVGFTNVGLETAGPAR